MANSIAPNPTHFIEVYYAQSKNTGRFKETDCLPIQFLEPQLKYTSECKMLRTVAIFKIQIK